MSICSWAYHIIKTTWSWTFQNVNVISLSLKHNILFNYFINGTTIPRTTIYRDLGVLFGRQLSFDEHEQISQWSNSQTKSGTYSTVFSKILAFKESGVYPEIIPIILSWKFFELRLQRNLLFQHYIIQSKFIPLDVLDMLLFFVPRIGSRSRSTSPIHAPT